ncbi:MAG TPA: ABC transporter permease subunit [Rhodanobacteraceae bacterium]|jgi:ABC-2 type transport system permease protein|nr:ABC transporter permease subunit [Rhodanobacteraceae bacterium]
MSAFAVARIDLKRLAVRPFAWTLAGIALAMMAWQFLLGVSAFMHAQPGVPGPASGPGYVDAVVAPYLLNYIQLCLVIAPLITMQALAGERSAQRLALLAACGASGAQIVLGKFAARLAFLWLLLIIVATMPLVLGRATHPDWGQFGAALIASASCVAALTAIGIACSAFTPEPALAAAAALLIGEGLSLIDAGVRISGGEGGWLGYLALHTHLEPAMRGLVRSEDIVYFLIVAALALALAVRRVGTERGRA